MHAPEASISVGQYAGVQAPFQAETATPALNQDQALPANDLFFGVFADAIAARESLPQLPQSLAAEPFSQKQLLIVCGRALGMIVASLILGWLFWVDLFRSDFVQMTDFANSCYVAGKIACSGQFDQLYPSLSATNYIQCQFPAIAHKLLPLIAVGSFPVWQYSPLNALVFVPFAKLSIENSLLAWQVLNILGTVLIAVLLAKPLKMKSLDVFLFCITFAPWFMMLKFGQQGILFGILPVCLGLALLLRNRPVLAGLALSLTFLNPKYLVISCLFAGLLFATNKKTALSLGCGVFFLLAITIMVSSWSTFLCWVHSLKLAELYLFDPHLLHRTFIYTSLPALAILNSPIEIRDVAKIVCYAAAALIAGTTVAIGFRSTSQQDPRQRLMLGFALMFCIMPVVEPHLLFYDLAGVVLSVLTLFYFKEKLQMPELGAIAITLWLAVNAYFLVFVLNAVKPEPMIFVLILSGIYVQLLKRTGRILCAK